MCISKTENKTLILVKFVYFTGTRAKDGYESSNLPIRIWYMYVRVCVYMSCKYVQVYKHSGTYCACTTAAQVIEQPDT